MASKTQQFTEIFQPWHVTYSFPWTVRSLSEPSLNQKVSFSLKLFSLSKHIYCLNQISDALSFKRWDIYYMLHTTFRQEVGFTVWSVLQKELAIHQFPYEALKGSQSAKHKDMHSSDRQSSGLCSYSKYWLHKMLYHLTLLEELSRPKCYWSIQCKKRYTVWYNFFH